MQQQLRLAVGDVRQQPSVELPDVRLQRDAAQPAEQAQAVVPQAWCPSSSFILKVLAALGVPRPSRPSTRLGLHPSRHCALSGSAPMTRLADLCTKNVSGLGLLVAH